MKDFMYQELKSCNKAIRNLEDADRKKWGYRVLIETIEKMCELSNIARKGGLLALEEAAYHLEDLYNSKFLETMIILIADETEPELVEEIGVTRYFALGFEDFEALQYMLMLQGSLSIQAGENPRIIKEKLLAFVPEEVVELYLRMKRLDCCSAGC